MNKNTLYKILSFIFISAVLVTIANYVFSKFLVFGKKKKGEDADESDKEEKEK